MAELVEAAPTSRAALGLVATLAALNEGRVHALFLADVWSAVGAECAACGALVVGVGHCIVCGAPTEPVADLRERVIERALHQGAKLEFVSGGAATLLAVHGGIGAWTRY